MCISSSVGRGGRNDLADVTIFQILFNLNRGHFPEGLAPDELKPDGRIGPNTINAIKSYETSVMRQMESDGILAPGDATVKALLRGLEPGPSKPKLAIVLPTSLPERIDTFFPGLTKGMTRYGITSNLQMAHFIAQIGLESGNFLYTEELASGSAYEGRVDLGNTHTGDGRRYKGRGLIQLTGRSNYTAYSKYTGIDYLANPDVVSDDPEVAVDVACWFWFNRDLGPLADKDDVKAVTKRINGLADGPHTHLDQRVANLNRAKAVLGI
jgi:putative chitinase